MVDSASWSERIPPAVRQPAPRRRWADDVTHGRTDPPSGSRVGVVASRRADDCRHGPPPASCVGILSLPSAITGRGCRAESSFGPPAQTSADVLTVYLSSTYEDLKAYREAAYEALTHLDVHVIGMEGYVARDDRPADRSVADAESADLYIGLFAFRYGYIPDDNNPECLSITEMEYRAARRADKPCLIFMVRDDAPWPRNLDDAVSLGGDGGRRIRELRDQLRTDRLVSWFSSCDDLRSVVTAAVSVHLMEDASAGRRERIWNVRREHKPSFTGRDAVLEDLRAQLTSGNPDAAIQVVHGPAGVGKTQVAAEYAHRYRNEYEVVWWIRAVEEQLTAGTDFANLARELDLRERDVPDQSVIIDAVRHWLGHHDRWLLVFDGAQDYPEIRPYLPPPGAGHVLITSRNQVWGGRVQSVALPVLALEDAAGFLLTRTASNEGAEARQLAAALDRLPLALEQAAAYIESTAISLADYLERFQTRLDSLWAVEQPPDDYPTTVDATWALAMDELRASTPVGADLVAVLAFVAADPLDRDVLETSADRLPETLARTIADPIERDRLMAAFRRYSLIEVTKDHLLVQALVQHVTRMRLGEGGRRAWAGTAVRLIAAAFPSGSDVVTWPRCEQLLPHALATVGHAERLGVEWEATSRLLHQMGHYLFARGDVAAAARQVTRALGNAQDTNDIEALIFLGNIHLYSGEIAKAMADATRALDVAREHGSPTHHARCLVLFGSCQMHSGDLPGAEASFRRGISLLEQLPSSDVDDIVYSELLGNLGSIEEIRGQWDDAESLHSAALRPRIENGHAIGVLESTLALGRVALGRGELSLAHELLADALRRAEDLDEKLQQAKIIHQRGELAFRMDDVDAAVDLVEDARRRFKECGTPYDVAQAELSLARMLAGSRPWESVELLAGARSKVERQGFALLRLIYPELDPTFADRIQAGLLAYAAGDALGLPWEARPPGEVRMAELEHLPATDVWPSGSTSDDTALTLLVAGHLARAQGLGEPIDFLAELAERSPQIPGLGPSTTRAIGHFTATGSPDESGSDTNGAPMRALPVGWAVPASDAPKRRAWTEALTRVTHTGNETIVAACVMSACAAWAIEGAQPPLLIEIAHMEAAVVGPDTNVARSIDAVRADSWQPPVDGITNDPAETVAAVLYCCRTADGLATALRRAVSLGGDTDTVAALVGGVLGCQLSPPAVSEQLTWLDRVLLPPREHLAALATSLATMRLAGNE